jgi:PTS system mannose-specific IIC component
VLGLALVVGLLDLDTMAVGLFMVSRPLVAGPLLGLLLGEPELGLRVGAMLELLWVGRMPLGAAVPADILLATALAVFSGSTVAEAFPEAAARAPIIGILISLPLGFLGGAMDRGLRRIADRLTRDAALWAAEGQEARFTLCVVQCLTLRFGAGFLSAVLLAPVWGWLGVVATRALHARLEPALGQAEWLLPMIGGAGILKLFAERGGGWYFLGGFLVTAVLGLLGVPGWIALVAAAFCAFWLVAEPFGRLRRALGKRARKGAPA